MISFCVTLARRTAVWVLALWAFVGAGGARVCAAASAPVAQPDLSFRHEVERAIARGGAWLEKNQEAKGWWSTPDQPAVTGLALLALRGMPAGSGEGGRSNALARGYAFLMSSVQPDGGIHRSNLVTYNTAIGLLALAAAGESKYEPVMRRARQFLVGLQRDFGERGRVDTPFDGGVGYGTKYEHSDMGNTLQALEALYHTRHLRADNGTAAAQDLNWSAAIRFLQSCQNLPSHNSEAWATDDPREKGGFVYYPGHSMAGSYTNSVTGRVALRSYGSISYGGLLSYIYADLKREDPRVTAVYEWLGRNFTLDENPGMGPQGLYYYYHTMAKALAAYGTREMVVGDGRRVDWPRELGLKLMNLQQRDGSWVNDHARWWEKDPALVTAYAVLTLEIVHRLL